VVRAPCLVTAPEWDRARSVALGNSPAMPYRPDVGYS
jgi:hypothetical protein